MRTLRIQSRMEWQELPLTDLMLEMPFVQKLQKSCTMRFTMQERM